MEAGRCTWHLDLSHSMPRPLYMLLNVVDVFEDVAYPGQTVGTLLDEIVFMPSMHPSIITSSTGQGPVWKPRLFAAAPRYKTCHRCSTAWTRLMRIRARHPATRRSRNGAGCALGVSCPPSGYWRMRLNPIAMHVVPKLARGESSNSKRISGNHSARTFRTQSTNRFYSTFYMIHTSRSELQHPKGSKIVCV